MNRRHGIVVAWLSLAAMIAVAVLRDTGPRVQGVPFRLLLRAESTSDPSFQTALRELGTNALPELIAATDANVGPLQDLLNRTRPVPWRWLETRSQSWRTAPAQAIRSRAMICLGSLGPAARPALPVLLGQLAPPGRLGTPRPLYLALLQIAPEDPEVRARVVAALDGPDNEAAGRALTLSPVLIRESLPVLLRLGATNLSLPRTALTALARFGPDAAPAVPWLTQLLPMPFHGPEAAETLAAIGPAAQPALPAALLLSRSNRLALPYNLILSLGPSAREAAPLLQRQLQNRVPLQQLLAAQSLATLSGRPADALPVLLQTLGNHNLVDASQSYRPRHPAFGSTLFGELELNHPAAAVWLIGELGPEGALAIPALQAATPTHGNWLSILAAWSLWRVTHQPDLVLPVLHRALTSPDPFQRHFALHAAAEMGPTAAPLEGPIRNSIHLDFRHRAEAEAALTALTRRTAR